jgi:WD40 repeat protein
MKGPTLFCFPFHAWSRLAGLVFLAMVVMGVSCQRSAPWQAATMTLPAASPQPSLQPEATAVPTRPGLVNGEKQAALPMCGETSFVPLGFSPDGASLYIQANPGVLQIDLASLAQAGFIQAEKPVKKAVLSPNGEILAMALEDHTIHLYRLPDGSFFRSLPGHADAVDALVFSPKSTQLFSGSWDTWVIRWEMSGEQTGEFQPGGGEVYALAVSPDGEQLAAITFEGPMRLWNAQTFEMEKELGPASALPNALAAYSPQGGELLTWLGGGPVSLWKLPEGELAWSGGNHSAAFSPLGDQFAHSDGDGAGQNLILVRSVESQEHLHSLPVEGMQWKLIYSLDGKWLVSADDQAIRVWDVETGRLLRTLWTTCE